MADKKKIIVFGGITKNGMKQEVLNDVWEYSFSNNFIYNSKNILNKIKSLILIKVISSKRIYINNLF